MTDAAPAGTSSTPSTSASPEAAAPVTPPVVDAKGTEGAKTPAEPVSTADRSASEPLFKLPEEIGFAPEVVSSFDAFIKGKMVDGKFNVTPQDIADAFAQQAQSANERWQQQIKQQNDAWEAQSKQRFTPAQRAVAEAGVGFITSKQLAAAEKAGIKDATPFRDLAGQFMNHPEFIAAMLVVGDSLKEDTFEQGNRLPPARKTLAERLYPSASKPS